MPPRPLRAFELLLAIALAFLILPRSAAQDADWKAEGRHGAVTAGGRDAVEAGMEILRGGGNAADAAVATLLALSVTDSRSFCFGGEVPIIVHDARRGLVEVVAGQGAAPRLATRERFAARGSIPGAGLEPAAVPAAPDAFLTVLERYGTVTFEAAAKPVLRLLDGGREPWHADLARTLRLLVDAERTGGGDRIRGLRRVADEFYRGRIAREIARWCEENGGLLRFSDLATHVTRIEDPVHADYRGYTVYKCGPWTQGPWLLEALNLLEGFDVASAKRGSPEYIHLVVESMKLALADRDVYYADPLFEEVPIATLLSKEYAALRRPLIDRAKASLVQRPGDPRGMRPLLDEAAARAGLGGPASDTTTCIVADSQGNAVVATPSGWSGVLVGKTGIHLGTRLQSFNVWEGHPNRIEPGKRPRITLTPTLVLKDRKPFLAVSVAGGDAQDQAALQMVLDAIDFGLSPGESVAAPRFGTDHHLGSFRQAAPRLGSLLADERFDEAVRKDLGARGHTVTATLRSVSQPCVIRWDASGLIQAAGDPREGRHAAAD